MFLQYRLGSYNEELHVYKKRIQNTRRIRVFKDYIKFDTIWIYVPCKNLHTWVKSS